MARGRGFSPKYVLFDCWYASLGMRRLPAGRVGRSSSGFRPAMRRTRLLCCALFKAVGYNFTNKIPGPTKSDWGPR